jgi:hypothetical protein
MATYFETGHTRNVANFQSLIDYCIGYGAAYQPAAPGLQLAGLQNTLQNARSGLDGVMEKLTLYNRAVGERQAAFAELKPFATRLVNLAAASGLPPKLIDDMKSAIRKLRGSGRNKRPAAPVEEGPGAEPVDKTVSTSRLSFDLQCEHFERLVTALRAENDWKPNEPHFGIAGLEQRLAQLKATCGTVNLAWGNVSSARIARNKALYGAESGSLYEVAMQVKKYVKAVFGAVGPEFRQISGIEFRKLK